ncbi:putative heterokaryon incompatibility [Diaporthe ampelina]|uniref:Putative heterokaryon incompatibility n=1 Tax=Diaporthe ampelina TaxID=1214573 RepID=A0A0G2FCN1_9PEZI|nr:putative heterokaryon incompatibility [Diaporthe ampelina]
MATLVDPSFYFIYQRLDMELPDAFRLLTLLPGSGDDPIECTVSHARRDESEYSGLSYTWGEAVVVGTIKLNGQLFPVTKNLEVALRGIRDSTHARVLWVDAICINQEHVPEKNQQVRHMQKVYGKAEKVFIWLGEADEASHRAISFTKRVCARLAAAGLEPVENLDPRRYTERDFERGLTDFLDPSHDDDWEAVAQFLMRPWWTRAWIVQEVVSAKNAEFRCGSESIDWSLMAMMIALLAHCKLAISEFPHPFRVSCAMDRSWSLLYMKHDFATKGEVDFLRLVDHRRRACSDLRDKIYSMLGMTSEETQARLLPDYNKPVAEVFASALAADIELNQDLEVLSFVDHVGPPGEYPSWVADLSRTPKTWRFYKYWPPPPALKWTPALPISFSDSFQALHVHGFRIDVVTNARVQGTDQPFIRDVRGGADDWSWNLKEIQAKLASGGPLQTTEGIIQPEDDEKLHRSVQRILYETLIGGQLSGKAGWMRHQVRYADEPVPEVSAPIEEEQEMQEHASTGLRLLTGQSRHIGLAPSGKAAGAADTQPPQQDVSTDRPLEWENILQQAMNQTLGRSLLLSKNRFLGLGPCIAQEGDIIYILFGLREAAVLRPRDDGSYMFVGTAYFHGLKTGKNLSDFKQGKFSSERVVLK